MKVICFDSWAQGAHHYERLVEAFKAKGIELLLIHLGSWGGEKGRPEEEMIGNLPVRDIAYYNGASFPEIIESENPAAVIFLSTHTFSHRAFNRYCRYRNIPTIHLYHGLVRVQAVVDGSTPYKFNWISRLAFAATQLPRALKHVWPTYAGALWKTGASAKEWYRFAFDIVSGALGMHPKTVADDARTDGCCIYAASDVENAVQRYGYARENVFVVGNPDLLQFGLAPDMIGSQLALPLIDRSDVMYIDTGLVYVGGFVFRSKEEFIRHMVDTKNELEQQGKHLIFKPHPQHLMANDVLSALNRAGIDICSNQEFLSRLQGCCGCIVEPTSLSVIPALMGMPLLLAAFGRLKDQRYGEVLTTYPRARLLLDLHNVNALLAAEQDECDLGRTMSWIEYNAGPLPADEMPERVANVVLKLVVDNKKPQSQHG